AVLGLEKCRRFLENKNKRAAKRAGHEIQTHFTFLSENPNAGRPLDDEPELREWVIPFGGSGYVCLYRYDSLQDTIYILAFRHQREAGYPD
ncbi:MAG TPA: type II toxin-antitoxin system RelE/ParE family toxin, partial [Hellea balneolensis]|nr:type II toxin-antitoxin system RelE/ParE family toxin [Hellea balneolensis]